MNITGPIEARTDAATQQGVESGNGIRTRRASNAHGPERFPGAWSGAGR